MTRRKYVPQAVKENVSQKPTLDFGMMAVNAIDSIMQQRNQQILSELGIYYGGQRDLYQSMGYKKTLNFLDYYNFWERTGVGKRIISSYPSACWRFKPIITDAKSDTQGSGFKDAITELDNKFRLFSYMKKGDMLSRIGQYGVIYLAFDDAKTPQELMKPVKYGSKLLYIQAFYEANAMLGTYVTDITNPRCGKPEFYNITMSNCSGASVHWTRVIHIAEDAEGGDIYGTPALKSIYNNIQNLEMISGAATEGYYRGGFAGIIAEVDKEVDFDDDAKTAFKEQMTKYVEAYQRILIGKGAKYTVPQSSVALPTAFADFQLLQISMGTRIPKRVLTGSEEAEAASTQDSSHWNNAVDERRIDHCEPNIARQTIDRLVEYGVLPRPRGNAYRVVWPDMESADNIKTSTAFWNITKGLQALGASGYQDKNIPKTLLVETGTLTQEQVDTIDFSDKKEDTKLYDKTSAIPKANP